ncbi:MAG: hypothetical protein U0T74_01235 [Chitinophagales bacterium]
MAKNTIWTNSELLIFYRILFASTFSVTASITDQDHKSFTERRYAFNWN